MLFINFSKDIVKFHVTFSIKQLKIFKAVVIFHPIYVMHYFTWLKVSPKMFLHYETMFKHIWSHDFHSGKRMIWRVHFYIPLRSFHPFSFPCPSKVKFVFPLTVTFLRTKLTPPLYLRWRQVKLFLAKVTFTNSSFSFGSIVTQNRAKLSRFWTILFCFARFHKKLLFACITI